MKFLLAIASCALVFMGDVKAQPTTATFVGQITSVDVDGNGPNSAQLLFTMASNGKSAAFVVLAYPSTEPQVFVSMSNLVTAAMFAKAANVEVTYEIVQGATNRAIGVKVAPVPVTGIGPIHPPVPTVVHHK
jgi:hypothetical protein